MSRLSTAFVLAYHGCDKKIAEKALNGEIELLTSREDFDWLGHGIYFWEGDQLRALEWARNKGFSNPFVIGAAIDLGNCLDLTLRQNIELLKTSFTGLSEVLVKAGKPLPENKDSRSDRAQDKLLRYLDCAVINHLHDSIEKNGTTEPFDTVRGLFVEGHPVYPGSGFNERTHTQIAVRTSGCIKGLFRPR